MRKVKNAVKLAKLLKDFALEKGADLIGIAPVERFAEAPEKHSPQYFLPGAKSVVSVALRISKAVLRNVLADISIFSYNVFGTKSINDQLNLIAYSLGRFLEDKGYEAYPLPANPPRDQIEWKMSEISHRHAAVAAGLGEIGWSNILLTPQFGARQKLVSILTTAPLEPDSLIKDKICSRCFKCVEICPVGAITKDGAKSFRMDKRVFKYAQVSWKCRWACGGLQRKGTFALTDIPLPESEPSAYEFFEYLNKKDPAQKRIEQTNGGNFAWCCKCLAVCSLK